MGTRIGIDTFDDLLASNERQFLDGIITGTGIAKIAGGILFDSVAFGGDEAEVGNPAFAKSNVTEFEELRREVVRIAVEGLFKTSIAETVRAITVAGYAFGHSVIMRRAENYKA